MGIDPAAAPPVRDHPLWRISHPPNHNCTRPRHIRNGMKHDCTRVTPPTRPLPLAAMKPSWNCVSYTVPLRTVLLIETHANVVDVRAGRGWPTHGTPCTNNGASGCAEAATGIAGASPAPPRPARERPRSCFTAYSCDMGMSRVSSRNSFAAICDTPVEKYGWLRHSCAVGRCPGSRKSMRSSKSNAAGSASRGRIDRTV